jgi:outer membrane protein TolC
MPSFAPFVFRFLVLISTVAATAETCAAADILKLSLREAIRLALLPADQARVQLALEAEKVAESQIRQARSAGAIHVDAGMSDRVMRFDLRSIGIDIPEVSPFVANVQFPAVVGPFTVLDSRVRVSKSIMNPAATRQVRAVEEKAEAARSQTKAVSAQVSAETARAYFSALRAQSDADLAAGNVKLAEARVGRANERKAQGLVTGGEVRRAELDVAEARQLLLTAETSGRRAILELLALIGAPLDTRVELTEQPMYHNDEPVLDDAIQAALRSRPEIELAGFETQALRLNERALSAQALPTLAVFVDAGAMTVAPTPTGNNAIVATPTYTAGFEFRVALLDGHRRDGQRAEIESQLRQAEVRQHAARRQIEVQVRLAFDSLQSSARQVELARQRVSLAEADSLETRARYDAGEASGIDLAEAQSRAIRSRHDHVTALYQHELARISLAEATGAIGEMKW